MDFEQERFKNYFRRNAKNLVRDIDYAERTCEKSLIKIRNLMEMKIRKAFQVQNVEVNLNLVRYKDLTEPLVQTKAPQESNEKVFNESFKESYPDDATGEFQPYKYYENEYDYHFMEPDVKKGFLNKLGEDAQRELGLFDEQDEERRKRGAIKNRRKYGRFGNLERFKNKKFGD